MKNILLPFIYPTVCLTCESMCSSLEHLLCDTCASSLELVDSEGRCPRCFYPLDGHNCSFCRKKGHPFSGFAFCFESFTPPALMAKMLHRTGKSFLARSLAAFLVLQFFRLRWPTPDAIIAAPSTWLQRLLTGFHSNLMLGQELAAFLRVPFIDGIKSTNALHSKASAALNDKIILFVHTMIDEDTLASYGSALVEGYPKKMYALSVCSND